MATVAAGAVKNRGVLFAQVYIDSIVSKLKDSNESGFLETFREWFAKADRSSLGNYVSSFVGPVFDVQGFVRSELSGNIIFLFEDRNRTKPLSLCYVVDFKESLDQTVKGKNYAVSLVKALKKTGQCWGVLTNGSSWRLYYTKEKALFETFFQIDIEKAIENEDKPEVALFTQFFNAQSFLLDEKGKCRLDTFRQESEEATKEIEEHLQSKMEDILGKICMGFIKSEGKQSHTEEEKRAVFDNSIYLLYRLLFVLYAEARGFLPVQNSDYYENSVSKLMVTVREYHRKGVANPEDRTLWNTLSEVFNWINQGNHALGIPPYNGGLFDNDEKPYLANHSIDDAYLSDALFSLGYREKKNEIFPISYDDLSVRHLGSLYEDILEYQLFIAPERMVRRKQGNIYKFEPASAGKVTRQDTVIERGEVYFSQSSEERKITGSYYTPEIIVQYMVENSLKPKLGAIDHELKERIGRLVDARCVAVDEEEKNRIEKFGDSEILSFLQKEVLSIKLLDPAMGSGHFLVNSSFYLANYIVEWLCSTDWKNDDINASPVWWRRQVVEKCIFGIDINLLSTELAKLSLWLTTADNKKPLTFLDHHLKTGNSLVGVTLDDLGAWSKNGNIQTVSNFQTTLSYSTIKKEYIPRVLKLLEEMNFSSEDIADIEKKKSKFAEWQKLKKNFEVVANTWLSTFFGYKIKEGAFQLLLQKAVELEGIPEDYEVEKIAHEHNFFHWWLEYPEIFFQTQNVGFDVIITNPPYLRIQEIQKANPYMAKRLKETYCSACGSYDVYVCFLELAINKINNKGNIAFILPHKFFQSAFGANIRELISRKNMLKSIVDFGHGQVFESATTYTCLLFLSSENNSFKFAELAPIATREDFDEVFNQIDLACSSFYSDKVNVTYISRTEAGKKEWFFSADQSGAVIKKIRDQPRTLADICDKIFQGIATSADDVFFLEYLSEKDGIIKAFSKSLNKDVEIEKKFVKPILKGFQVHKWRKPTSNFVCVFPYEIRGSKSRRLNLEEIKTDYPLGYQYLNENKKLLQEREHGRFKDNWWEFSRPQNLTEYSNAKIITPEISLGCNMTFDKIGFCHNTKCYSIVLKKDCGEDPLFLLAFLNSRILWFFLTKTGYVLRGGYFVFKTNYLMPFPLPREMTLEEQKPLISLVIRILDIVNDNDYSENSGKQAKVAELEETLNQTLYILYGLTSEEIRAIELKSE